MTTERIPPWDGSGCSGDGDTENGTAILTRYSLSSGFTYADRKTIPTTSIWFYSRTQRGLECHSGTIGFRTEIDQPRGIYHAETLTVQAELPLSSGESILHCLSSGAPVQMQFRIDRQSDDTQRKKLTLFLLSIRSPDSEDRIPQVCELPYPFIEEDDSGE